MTITEPEVDLKTPDAATAAAPALETADHAHDRRGLLRRATGLAVAATTVVVAPALTEPAAAASSKKGAAARRKARKHAKKCKHFHRCAKHRNHTCRKKHRCAHRLHKAPKKKPAPAPKPATAPKADLPQELVVRRFTYGPTSLPAQGGVAQDLPSAMKAAGGVRAWFEKQLSPASVPDPLGDEIDTWWPSLRLPSTEIGARHLAKTEEGWVVEANLQRWTLARRIHSTRQVHEVMTEFWQNHLHVTIGSDGQFPHRPDYDRTIRKHALGTFVDLLHAAVTHPSMGIYLTNATSTAKAPNENLGRELLELHTVGTGHYGEDDVKNSARILTGWRSTTWTPWTHGYDPKSHWTGPVKVMGFSHANAATDGRAVTRAYLTYLAKHPATARRIARKLAVRFVAENPSDSFVQRIADTFLASGTDIKATLRFVVESPEFRAATVNTLVRTPTDDSVATFRALGVRIKRPVNDTSTANQILWITRSMGQSPFAWPRPDGPPTAGAAWSSPARLIGSFRVHWNIAFGWYPKQDATLLPVGHWMGATTATAEQFVTRAATALLGSPPSKQLVDAGLTAIGLASGAVLTRNGDTVTTPGRGNIAWELPVVLATILDSPTHMHR